MLGRTYPFAMVDSGDEGANLFDDAYVGEGKVMISCCPC